MRTTLIIISAILILFSCKRIDEQKSSLSFEEKVEDYIKKYPYQETYNYSMRYTGGDPSALNKPLESKAELTKAGEDIVVRMNNDTYYTAGLIYLSEGPVKLSAQHGDPNRFYSFQLMDERNCNFHNIIRPKGEYYVYYGDPPEGIEEDQLIEAPSLIAVAVIRVEVKDKNDPADVEAAKKVFNGINVSGPEIDEFPSLDLLSAFEDDVVDRAHELMDSILANVNFRELVAAPEQVPGEVSYLNLAAASKGGWGGPVSSHSTYELILFDRKGEEMLGNNGTYTITTKEPPVHAFWSITVYDTERGGFLHPNKDDRYHINNTGAVNNPDGTVTFTFKTQCNEGDLNCLEVPEGRFDIVARYYLPKDELISGQWSMPLPVLDE